MKQLENFREKRSFNDRRQFTYTSYSPERRSGTGRRQEDLNKKLKAKTA